MSFSSHKKTFEQHDKIKVFTNEELKAAVNAEIEKYGLQCSLNHIDVSDVKDFSGVFSRSKFIGDISEWDVSNGVTFESMFDYSEFNSDISKWNMASAENFTAMFAASKFNRDIALWNVSKVRNMNSMFLSSEFDKDISMWDVSNVVDFRNMFYSSKYTHDLSQWKPGACMVEHMFASMKKSAKFKIPDWYTHKYEMYTAEISKLKKLRAETRYTYQENTYDGMKKDLLKRLAPNRYSVYLNDEMPYISSKDDNEPYTHMLYSFVIHENMTADEYNNLYKKIKDVERTALRCVYKTTAVNYYPYDFITHLYPWLTKKNNRGGQYNCTLYLVRNINMHAKRAGLPLMQLDKNGAWFLKN